MSSVPGIDPGVVRRKGKQCNCKNSRCLKLYCECFASGQYCEPGSCNCLNCFNNRESEQLRAEAVEATLERNPAAFRPKIAQGMHKGCNCKKSFCLKKYCECFQAGIVCTELCKCVDCRNYDGCPELAATLNAMPKAFAAGGPKKKAKGAAGEVIPSYDALYQPAPPPGRNVPSRRAAAALAPPMPPHAMALPPHHVAARGVPSGLEAGYGGYAAKDAVDSGAGQAPAYAVPSAVPMLLGDLQELKAHGRTGSNAPELAIIPDFGIITQETIREEAGNLIGILQPTPEITAAAVPYTADFERQLLASALASLRQVAVHITSKHSV